MRPIGIPMGIVTLAAAMVSVNGLTVNSILPLAWITILLSYIGFAPNDYFDKETDQRNGRKGGIQGNVITNAQKEKLTKYVNYVVIVLILATSYFLPLGAGLALLGVSALSLAYSVPPIRLKEVPILDSLSNFLMAYLSFQIGVGLAGKGPESIIGGAFWFALIYGGGGHALGTVVDYKPDKEAGLSTIGIFLGKKTVVAIFQSLIVAALIFEKWSYETKIFLILTFYTSVIASFRLKQEFLSKVAILGAAGYTVYGLIWIWLRI